MSRNLIAVVALMLAGCADQGAQQQQGTQQRAAVRGRPAGGPNLDRNYEYNRPPNWQKDSLHKDD